MKKNKPQDIFSIRLDKMTRQVLEFRAKQKQISIAKYLRQLLQIGLEKEQDNPGNHKKYSKLEKILLKNSIETTMLLHYMMAKENTYFLEEIKQKSQIILKELCEEHSV